MAVTFSEIGGKWTFKARVHPKGQGAVYKSPSRLWDTQEDAEKDVGLFIWYKSAKSKDKNQPNVPLPHGEWFVTTTPNEKWDEIRAFLVARVPEVKAVSKRTSNGWFSNREEEAHAACMNRKKAKISEDAAEVLLRIEEAALKATALEAEATALEAEVADRVQKSLAKEVKKAVAAALAKDAKERAAEEKVKVLRKDYTDLSDRRKREVHKDLQDLLQNYWSRVAPSQPDTLDICLKKVVAAQPKAVEVNIVQAYKLAKEKNNEDLKTELLSIFVMEMQQYMLDREVSDEVEDSEETDVHEDID